MRLYSYGFFFCFTKVMASCKLYKQYLTKYTIIIIGERFIPPEQWTNILWFNNNSLFINSIASCKIVDISLSFESIIESFNWLVYVFFGLHPIDNILSPSNIDDEYWWWILIS